MMGNIGKNVVHFKDTRFVNALPFENFNNDIKTLLTIQSMRKTTTLEGAVDTMNSFKRVQETLQREKVGKRVACLAIDGIQTTLDFLKFHDCSSVSNLTVDAKSSDDQLGKGAHARDSAQLVWNCDADQYHDDYSKIWSHLRRDRRNIGKLWQFQCNH